MEFLFTYEEFKEIQKSSESFLSIYKNGLYDGLSEKLRDRIFWGDLEAEAMELANPNTRESAKLKYVEPEPLKYVWWYSEIRFINKKGNAWYLDNNGHEYDSDIQSTFTEEEIDASPFKKEFFTKKK